MSIRLVNYDCNITEIPPGEYKAHVEGVWGPSEVEQIVTVHIAVDAGYADYKKIFKEEKKVKKINTVRVVGVTFNANTHNGNDERVFNYISPYDVSKGDIIIADTCYGPSLAVVKHVTYYDYTERNKWCGLKSTLSDALNIKGLKTEAFILTQQMINDCTRDSEILAEIQRVKKDIATFEKGIEIAKAEYIDSSNECNKLAEKMSNLEIARKFHEGELYKLKAKAGLL